MYGQKKKEMFYLMMHTQHILFMGTVSDVYKDNERKSATAISWGTLTN